MTHLLEQSVPKSCYLLLKPDRPISAGDTIIFQEDDKETPVKIVSVETGGKEEGQTRGLHQHYQIISWLPLP